MYQIEKELKSIEKNRKILEKYYKEYYLKANSKRFVRKIWIVDNSKGSESIIKSILPNGCLNIAIIKGQGAEAIINNKRLILHEGVFLCSQMTNKVIVSFGANTKVFFIQFEAWITSYFEQYDYSKFIDTIEKLDNDITLFGLKTKELKEKNIGALTDSINTYFFNNKTRFNKITEVEKLAREVIEKKGQIDLKNIYKHLNISQRTFQNIFKKSTGLSLSKFMKIIKLRATIDEMRTQKSSKNLTSVALDNEYYDQAHFIKSFKEITQTTPKKFIPKNYLLSSIR